LLDQLHAKLFGGPEAVARKSQNNEIHQISSPVLPAELPAERALLTSRETGRFLNVSQRTLYYLTSGRKPKLAFVKLGKSKRFVVADVLEFIEKRRVRAAYSKRSVRETWETMSTT
jgi:Helix-turn-helix domain